MLNYVKSTFQEWYSCLSPIANAVPSATSHANISQIQKNWNSRAGWTISYHVLAL